jgi:hypothetical protein
MRLRGGLKGQRTRAQGATLGGRNKAPETPRSGGLKSRGNPPISPGFHPGLGSVGPSGRSTRGDAMRGARFPRVSPWAWFRRPFRPINAENHRNTRRFWAYQVSRISNLRFRAWLRPKAALRCLQRDQPTGQRGNQQVMFCRARIPNRRGGDRLSDAITYPAPDRSLITPQESALLAIRWSSNCGVTCSSFAPP